MKCPATRPVEKWLPGFLARYIATLGPHDWPEDAEGMTYFREGWVMAFKLAHPPIEEAEADEARKRLAAPSPGFLKAVGLEHRPRYKGEHCPAVCAVVLAIRERDATRCLVEALDTPPEQARAEVGSKGCPECAGRDGNPTGFAHRKGVWADRSWHATTALYCRCPLGRYRLGREEMDPPPFDDLQALPALWDRSLSHPSWSHRPTPPPSVEGRLWRYLGPGELAPPTIAAEYARTAAAPPRKRAPGWAGKVPEDLPMPKPIPRPEPPREGPPDDDDPEPDTDPAGSWQWL